ncbi:MAG: vitamin K epoxide reductase family protein [Pyrinomonadaceae bacterium]
MKNSGDLTAGADIREGDGRGAFFKSPALLDGLTAAFALIGLADSVYLTAGHLAGRGVRCTIVTGCNEVLSSPYAAVGGVPLAALGAAAYFTVFSLAVLSAFGHARAVRTPLAVVVGLMFATTLWLLFVQAFLLRAFCEFCLLSAAVTLALTAILLLRRLTRSGKTP